ncbi:MAG: hypothetical protein RIG84_11920 [Roseovarius sp.]
MTAAPALAQDQSSAPHVSVELNAAEPGEGSCKLSFLIVNSHAEPIEKAVYETVLFNGNGQVERLTLFDFGELPAGRPRVRQFTVNGLACENLSQILINGAHECTAPGLAPEACEQGLELATRTDVELIG